MDTATILDTMDIFITWSGPRSLAVAEALKEYLPMIVNAFSPWLSKTNIDKGANWSTELTAALANARAGIICLTPSNLAEPWILFEAGAIAKAVTEKPLACTLLIGLKSSDLTGPLALFQDTKQTRDDLLQLVKTLNNALGKDALKETQIEKAFDLVWPKLKERLDNLPADGPTERPQRTDRDLLEEILDSVRSKSASDALLLTHAEARMEDLRWRLAHAETALAMERARLNEMQAMAAYDADGDLWVTTGKAMLSRTQPERAAEALGQPKDAVVIRGGPFARAAKKAMENAQKIDPKAK